jgi:hypothetical protein
MRLTEFMEVIGRAVTYYPTLHTITGGVLPTLSVCQLVYWTGKGSDPDGWIYKTQQEWTDELGLSRWEQESARRELRKRGLLEERYKGLPRRLEYRVKTDALNDAWEARHSAYRLPSR